LEGFKKIWKEYVSSKNAVYGEKFGFTGKNSVI
jgi:hypothetical protein